MLILNIAAGKLKPLLSAPEMKNSHLLINLDTSYYSATPPDELESWVQKLINHGYPDTCEYFCNEDAFTFMERTQLVFDRVCVYRFLEHVPMDRVLYFIYLLSTVTEKGGIVDIIVPNYETLAQMLLDEDVEDSDFEAQNIILTTEIVNEPGCPHASLWTVDRAIHFFELEKRFEVSAIEQHFEFDGRDIYLRFQAERV
jgi:hypothetical protein